MTRLLLSAAVLALSATRVAAQNPTPSGTAAAPAPAAAPTMPAAPTPPANYVYSVDGRRDPFVALIGRTGQRAGATPEVRPEGLAGIGTDEVSVRGIMQSQGAWVAMVTGPTGKVFMVHPGDRLADGTIRAITPQAVVIVQQLNDPLSLEKQREVRKFLRGGETK